MKCCEICEQENIELSVVQLGDLRLEICKRCLGKLLNFIVSVGNERR